MILKHFRAVVAHDHGTLTLHITATSKKMAINIITSAEGCPPFAIVSVREQRRPRPKKKPKRLWKHKAHRAKR